MDATALLNINESGLNTELEYIESILLKIKQILTKEEYEYFSRELLRGIYEESNR